MRLSADSASTKYPNPRFASFDEWTIEELRAFGAQMQLPEAHRKTRGELLAMLGVSAAPGGDRRAND